MTNLYADLGAMLAMSKKWDEVGSHMKQAGSNSAATTSGLENGRGWRAGDFINAHRSFAEKFFKAISSGVADAQHISSTLDSVVKDYAERDHLSMDQIEKSMPK